jgi:hypothetical protein
MSRSPRRAANGITQILNQVFGADRFDRGPVDVEALAIEYSRQVSPEESIDRIVAEDLGGCEGVLVPGDQKPRQWAIMYDRQQNLGRRAYTIAHELGHFVLHRTLVDEDEEFDGGFYCDKNAIEHGAGADIEKEANEFAATLLMPFDDFRKTIPANEMPDFGRLGAAAARYGVSLTAAILRWLDYTTTRSMLIASTDGFAHWAKPSDAAFKSGLFLRTRSETFEMPQRSLSSLREFGQTAQDGVEQNGVWFGERVVERCIRTDRYDFELTLLQFDNTGPRPQAEDEVEDTYTRFFAMN